MTRTEWFCASDPKLAVVNSALARSFFAPRCSPRGRRRFRTQADPPHADDEQRHGNLEGDDQYGVDVGLLPAPWSLLPSPASSTAVLHCREPSGAPAIAGPRVSDDGGAVVARVRAGLGEPTRGIRRRGTRAVPYPVIDSVWSIGVRVARSRALARRGRVALGRRGSGPVATPVPDPNRPVRWLCRAGYDHHERAPHRHAAELETVQRVSSSIAVRW